jgi:hypothetical protein
MWSRFSYSPLPRSPFGLVTCRGREKPAGQKVTGCLATAKIVPPKARRARPRARVVTPGDFDGVSEPPMKKWGVGGTLRAE